MLKGHVFKEQKFGNQIFALFINTFLDGKNGIHNDYKNSMAVTYSGSNVTVDSGVVCIQGRFLEEETSTTINAGTDALYCKLVIEIDLSKINTVNDLNQACYKLVTGVNTYPALTQNNIVKNNTGIYQYELARFRTTSSGILEFQDMRTYLDFDSIYEEIRQHIQDIDDESIFVLKSDMRVLYSNTTGTTGNVTLSDSVANYDYIEIQCKRTGFIYSSGKIYNANGKTISLTASNATEEHIYLYSKLIQINGNTITAVRSKLMYLNDQMQAFVTDNDNYITRVVGYKLQN
ncbi:MAG: hypothetical protein U0L98_01705 [Clostridia bacterium]|nr:hypothetical protein [Clostridia bacterium]